jgi:hypothetical protein
MSAFGKIITFKWSINEPVRLVAIDVEGRVLAMQVSLHGLEYRVAYWYEGEYRTQWLPAEELK